MACQSVNPYNGETTKTFDELTDAQLETALATAQSCFETWRHKSYAERATIVAKASELMIARSDELAQTMTLEMGKRIGEARGEVEFSARILAYYAENAERFLAPVELHPTVGTAHMESSPIGTDASWATWASRSSSTRSWYGSPLWRLPPEALERQGGRPEAGARRNPRALVERAHELYEALGREDVQAVQE